MPDNKMLDGIKKISGRDLGKAREMVLKSIGEDGKHSHKPSHAQKSRAETGRLNFEKEKKYNISKAKKVDGIFSGKISNAEKNIHHNDEADKKFKQEEENRILAQQEKRILADEKNKQEEERQAMLNKRAIAEKLKSAKTQKYKNTKTRKRKSAKTQKHESAATKVLNRISGKKIANSFSAKIFLKSLAYALLVLAIALILFYILFFIALVNFNFDSNASRKASEYLSIPALATKIGVVEYYDYKDAKENFYYYNQENLEEKVRQELIQEIVVDGFLEEYGIQITAEEQKEEFSKITGNKHNNEIKEIMGAYYGLGAERYMERVIKPRIAREKANQAILHNQEINYLALLRIAKIRQAVEIGKDFYTVAEEIGDGFGFGKYYDFDEAVSMFGDLAKNLDVGQTSDVIVINNRYYVIHCFARRENSIGLRHVFINAKSLDDYIQEAVSGLRVWSFVD